AESQTRWKTAALNRPPNRRRPAARRELIAERRVGATLQRVCSVNRQRQRGVDKNRKAGARLTEDPDAVLKQLPLKIVSTRLRRRHSVDLNRKLLPGLHRGARR